MEAGEELLADEKAASSDELALQERVANFDAFFVRIDDPGDSSTTGKTVLY